ncbi:MAG: glycosyltransferase family 4 protein [Candidatus Kuenenia sp.]|nr:glycosyltransferase family 4 protein [Candidatus Kuenenia hertensis]
MSHQPSAINHSKLKITVLGTRGFPQVQGGVEAHCENLYPQLVERGCDVVVFTRKPYVNNTDTFYKGVHLIPLFCPKNKFLEAFFHTFIGILAAKKHSPDILHIHAIGPSLMVPLARLLGFKVVMTHHGPDYQRKKWGKLAKIVLKLGEKYGCKWANSIITISDTIADHIKNRYKKNVKVIPNGVILPDILQSNDCLMKYGLTKGNYILAVGRFVPEKGFHDLITAFNQLYSVDFTSLEYKEPLQTNHWKLVIVGEADHEDVYSTNLKVQAKKNSDIILTGFLTGKPLQELYSNAGIFVLPSYYEGLPIVLLEALSYGLSCIASNIPANKNVKLSDDRFFEVGNITSLAKKIQAFMEKPITDKDKREQRNMIVANYDWGNIAEETLEVYKKVINRDNDKKKINDEITQKHRSIQSQVNHLSLYLFAFPLAGSDL